jgi:hypothetical protein
MRALTCLDVSGNSLVSDSGWINADKHGFKKGDMVDYNGVQCSVSMETDFSYKVRDISGILALADGIRDNGALSVLSPVIKQLAEKVALRRAAVVAWTAVRSVRENAGGGRGDIDREEKTH